MADFFWGAYNWDPHGRLKTSVRQAHDSIKELIDFATEAGYGKLCPNKTDQLQKIVENRDEINIEHVLDQKLPSTVNFKEKIQEKGQKNSS